MVYLGSLPSLGSKKPGQVNTSLGKWRSLSGQTLVTFHTRIDGKRLIELRASACATRTPLNHLMRKSLWWS